MKPELYSIGLDMLTETSTIVKIVYKVPKGLNGIELMGVDSGLSWLKGQSISMKKEGMIDDKSKYVAHLEVSDSCEFRARGYDSEEDHWEEGLANHRIERNDDGTISFQTELDRDLYHFKGSVPINYSPSVEDAAFRVKNVEDEKPPLFQLFIDLSVWVDTILDDPLEGENIYPISAVMRYIKIKNRDYDSKKVDDLARPVIKTLYRIYRTALDFAEDDIRYLTGGWDKEGYIQDLKNLPEKVKVLDEDPALGKGKDAGDKFKELLKYAS